MSGATKRQVYEAKRKSFKTTAHSFNELQEERRRTSLFNSLEKRVVEQEKLISLLEKQRN